MILCLQTQSSFLGDYNTSAYTFKNYNLQQASFHSDGKTYPSFPFNLDFSEGKKQDYTNGYISLFKNGGLRTDAGPCVIQLENYADYYFFLAFYFGEESNYGDHFTEKSIGNVNLSLTFGANSNPALKVLLWVETQEVLSIDQLRNIKREFQL